MPRIECASLQIQFFWLICNHLLVVCPLEFKEPAAVINACRASASPNPLCCDSLNAYIAAIQKQMLITNSQAINCATLFGSMLQKGGVMTDVYELCDVDLKDFSLQGILAICVPFPFIHCCNRSFVSMLLVY